jgi:hypothetical protein
MIRALTAQVGVGNRLPDPDSSRRHALLARRPGLEPGRGPLELLDGGDDLFGANVILIAEHPFLTSFFS